MIDVVLDTNCLIASLSRRGKYFEVWQGLQSGTFHLCVSNEILEEYEEIISRLTNHEVASNVVQMLINSPFVRFITPYYHFHLIQADSDDNKFVDCAIAGNAKYIVSEDAHFRVLNDIEFPHVTVIRINDFIKQLKRICE